MNGMPKVRGGFKIVIVEDPKHTTYLYGDLSELSGQTLSVVDTSVNDDSYLAILDNKGLVDVDIRDVHQVIKPPEPAEGSVESILKSILGGISPAMPEGTPKAFTNFLTEALKRG